MYKIINVLFLLITSVCLNAANTNRTDLNVSIIPDSLKKDAYAVVRFSHNEFEYKTSVEGVEKISNALTILDKKGSDYANFVCSCDKFRDLKKFSAKLYSATGTLLNKFKLSDVNSTEYSSSLASDAKAYYFNCDLPTLPVTIVYEYEVSWKNGILCFPVFMPQKGYNLSVENADYKLILPENLQIRKKEINISDQPDITTDKEISTKIWTVKNLAAIEYERYNPSLDRYVPILYVDPINFVYDGVPGSVTDWESLGKWDNSLIEGRDILSDDTKSHILEMTKDAKSEREKVKILYDYLGKTTRYVSIQLGIGGFQPMPAAEVCKTGFGDCKALSNYLKAMLSVAGIPSYYTSIRLDKYTKSIFKDYANFYQFNHVILQVPLPNDTLWLECTNPRVPFGFIHNGISGHDALVDYNGSGKIARLADYPDSLNLEINKANITLHEDGSAEIKVLKSCKTKIYDNFDWFPLASKTEQIDFLRKSIRLPAAQVEAVKIFEDKSQIPGLEIDFSCNTENYGTKTGNRLFVPINPYRELFSDLKKSTRKHDISVQVGYKDVDSIFIAVPNNFEIESMPGAKQITTVFGSFESGIKVVENGIYITHSLMFNSGEYNVSAYPDLVDFFDKINSEYKSKIILKKKI